MNSGTGGGAALKAACSGLTPEPPPEGLIEGSNLGGGASAGGPEVATGSRGGGAEKAGCFVATLPDVERVVEGGGVATLAG